MLTNLSVVRPYQDRLLVSVSGIETLTEVVHRDTDGPSSSCLQVTFSGVQISGLISYLYYELYDEDVWATNTIEFLTAPSGLDTLTISGIVYTFVNTLSGVNNVPILATAELCAVALYRVLTAQGTSGTDFWAGQTPNATISGIIPDNPLALRFIIGGLIGNVCPITTTSAAININSKYFSGGKNYRLVTPVYHGAVSSGITNSGLNSNVNKTFALQDVPFATLGQPYYTHMWFSNISGLQTLDTLGNPSSYWKASPFITGRTYLPYYAEVSGLVGYNLYAGGYPSDGKVGLIWSHVNTMRSRAGLRTKLAYPNASGVQIQASGIYTYADQGQKIEYVIFVFKSTSGTAAQCSWPRSVDSNGTWYYAGKTPSYSATLHLPPASSSKFSVWVGFGNKDTRKTSGLPFNSVLSTIYIE